MVERKCRELNVKKKNCKLIDGIFGVRKNIQAFLYGSCKVKVTVNNLSFCLAGLWIINTFLFICMMFHLKDKTIKNLKMNRNRMKLC